MRVSKLQIFIFGKNIHLISWFAGFEGSVGDLVQKKIYYAGWKSLHIPIAITKLSDLNVFILSVEGVVP